MEMFLNTANPIIILFYTLIIVAVIVISRKVENTILLIIILITNVRFLIYHSVKLETTSQDLTEVISNTYHCIAFDLVFLLLIFITYLWVDNIRAKTKKIKTYEDGLDWFWNKL